MGGSIGSTPPPFSHFPRGMRPFLRRERRSLAFFRAAMRRNTARASAQLHPERLRRAFCCPVRFVPEPTSLSPCSKPSRGFRGINGTLPAPGGRSTGNPSKCASAPGAGPLHLFHVPLTASPRGDVQKASGRRASQTPPLRGGSTAPPAGRTKGGARAEVRAFPAGCAGLNP